MQSYFHHPAFNQNFDDGMYSKAKFYHDIMVTSSGSKGLTHKYCNSSANAGPIYNWSQSFLYSMNGNFLCVCLDFDFTFQKMFFFLMISDKI